MSEQPRHAVGSIGWIDLTVPDADSLKEFYSKVVGWAPQPLSMGDYADYVMTNPATQDGVAGICHARGSNQGIPPVWMIYIIVADLDTSLRACESLGGEIVKPPRDMGGGARFAMIRDPAGVVCALFQSGPEQS